MLRIGIDSFCLDPLALKPHQMLQWAYDNGAEGVAFSSLSPLMREEITVSYLHDLGMMAKDMGLYLEWGGGQHIPFNPADWSNVDILPVNMKAAGEAVAAGARIVRSGPGGLLRANPSNPATGHLIKDTIEELRRIMPMLTDNGVVLAIETNFEFTTFELLKIFEKCGAEPGGCFGICLDTMNLLTMLEDPVMATKRIAPWVVSTSIKDGGLTFSEDGMTAFPAALGSGIINIKAIISLLLEEGKDINLSVRSQGGSYLLPIHEPWYIGQFPDLTITEYNNLMLLENRAEALIESGGLTLSGEEEMGVNCEVRVRGDLKKLRDLSSSLA
jgi:3-oxoisoapionate decarboxylase